MKKKNIILICIDSARKDRFSCYGYNKKTTPFMDSLAKKGNIFKNAYAASTWTLPSHISMFTGLYPRKHGVLGYTDKLDKAIPTFMQLLGENGYHTSCISNNLLVSDFFPTKKGFSEIILVDLFEKRKVVKKEADENKKYHTSRFLIFRIVRHPIRYFLFFPKWFIEKVVLRDSITIKELMKVINLSKKDKGESRINKIIEKKLDLKKGPFFIYLNYMSTHRPYALPKSYRKKLGISWFNILKYSLIRERIKKSDKKGKLIMNSIYDAELAYADSKIKELMDIFSRKGLMKDTIFIITSDHGELLGEQGRVGHVYPPHDKLINIPLIIYPKIKGIQSSSLVSHVDIFPTILNLAGIKNKHRLDGLSLLAPSKGREIISEFRTVHKLDSKGLSKE